MRDNPVQFAVVREDPEIESQIVQAKGVKSALVVGSGGCTALSLACRNPNLKLAIFDMNPAQIALVERKTVLLKRPLSAADKIAFGIGLDTRDGLCTGGNFEALFRGFREFLIDFVAEGSDLTTLFVEGPQRTSALNGIVNNKFWPVAFELFFSDALLETMFGPAAVQHAERGSYPGYFRRMLERGLRDSKASDNYFLHHIFLGYYLSKPQALPAYLRAGPTHYSFPCYEGDITSVPNLETYDLISLSNIFDWMDDAAVKNTARFLAAHVKPGCILIWRQLGHEGDASSAFSEHWSFDHEFAASLLRQERSLFYSRIYIATKV